MAKKIDEKRRMTVQIGDKTYPLRFGMKFLKEINQEDDGLVMALAGLLDDDPIEVFRLLKAATNTYDDITDQELEDFFELEADFDQLVKDFLQMLQAMNTTRKVVKNSLPSLRKLVKQQKEMGEIEMKRAEREYEAEMAKAKKALEEPEELKE